MSELILIRRNDPCMNSAASLLLKIGIPKNRLYCNRIAPKKDKSCRHFWNKPEGDLINLLGDARTIYRQSIRMAHPDRGGCHAKAAELNVLWNRVRYLFAKRNLVLP